MRREAVQVSAIIIVLNGEAYLEQAVRSVQGQTLKDWELLIVDDGSADGTIAIGNRFAESDARIRLLRHPDRGTRGMSDTRNLGLSAAAGDYVAFLDADDVWLPEKLAEQAALLKAHPAAAMVYGRTLIWNEWAGGNDFFYELGVAPDRLHEPPKLFFQLLENRYQTPTTCNAMIRRQAALDAGSFDGRFRGMFEDQVFFAKILALHPVYVSGQTWAKYRQHADSSSAGARAADVFETHVRYLMAIRGFLIARGKRFSKERLAVERTIARLVAGRAKRAIRSRLREALR
ncbi:glycosyltransferase family 2 protein [Sphingomonas sp. URHD0057]|uniref:glycosyltransferase family 2 protein n=1 Tax=Sphingomonas sp. URHD0057 TaxID=1380389 RepID=UPI000684A48D|nr:glycosyltransferase [Sphingomonas sp. URHD0057]